MSVFAKVAEWFLKHDGLILIISLFTCLIFVSLFPYCLLFTVFYNHDWNVIVNIVLYTLTLSAIIYGIKYLVIFIKSLISKHKRKIADDEYKLLQTKQVVETVMKMMDNVSDLEYSIIMHLLENENKVPYIEHGETFHVGNSILDNDKIFHKTRSYTMEQNLGKEITTGWQVPLHSLIVTHYLLTDEAYKYLHYTLETEKKISHFDRNRIKLN